MKKLISFLLAALMIFSLCACGSSSNSASDSKQEASTPMESAANDDIAYEVLFRDVMKKCEVYFFFKYFFTLAFVLELTLSLNITKANANE